MSARLLILAVSVLLLSGESVYAEIYRCGNLWTSKQCESPSEILTESISPTPKPVTSAKDAKQLRILQLYKLRRSAARDFGIEIEVADIEEFCYQAEVSPLECGDKVLEREAAIRSRIENSLALKLQQQRLRDASEQAPNTVVIVENRPRDVVVIKKDRHRRAAKHEPRQSDREHRLEHNNTLATNPR
ncbi:MAG: hypothetical protein KDD42_06760 [Bdellovibrionales bacterium]|nr:hypothetical protein [Bdellovibrionales bacterium]